MSRPTHDAVLQIPRPWALHLHVGIVVALDRQHVHVAKVIDQSLRHATQVRRISDAHAEAVDPKAMRAHLIVSQRNGVNMNSIHRRERPAIERHHQRLKRGDKFRLAKDRADQFRHPPMIAINANLPGNDRLEPAETDVIAIQVSQADRAHVVDRNPRAFVRLPNVRGPMPASISTVPPGERSTEQFPLDPLARIHNSSDIRVAGL